jgi:hypothetical protein
MAEYNITSPSGEKYKITAPDDATQDQVISYAQKQFGQSNMPANKQATKQPESYSTLGAIGTGAMNLIPSTYNVAKGAVQAAMHPVNTLEGLIQASSGAISKALPESVMKYAIPEKRQAAEQVANAIGKDYADKYGSYEGFKRAVAENPAGVLADISTVATGGGALLKGAAEGSKAAKFANILNKTSEVTNPLKPVELAGNAALTSTGNLLSGALGVTTGVGGNTIKTAYGAGKTGNKAFWNNLTEKVDPTEVLDTAKNALLNMKMEKNNAYRSGMLDVSNDKSILNFDDINQSLSNANDKVSFKGQVKDKLAATKVQETQNEINKWKNLDPAEYHTPEGMDALKQKIGSILETIPFEQKTARSAVQDIYNSTRKTIADQAPSYDKVMKDYSEASDLVNQIQKTLSLPVGQRGSIDTAMRKLQSLTRNNVQTNYGQRVKLAEELAKHGGEDIMPALAGQAMSEWSPRGIVGKGEDLAAIYAAFTHPQALAAFPLAMPRVVGGAAYGLGKAAGAGAKLGNKIPLSVDQANKIGTLLYQMNQNKEQQ